MAGERIHTESDWGLARETRGGAFTLLTGRVAGGGACSRGAVIPTPREAEAGSSA